MSLRTRIRGFTAWVNVRLTSTNDPMNNVLTELLTGTNMKNLLLSMTGSERDRLQSFDGLTDEQKRTRVEWMVKDLKRFDIIPNDVFVDARMFAMRSAEHIFELLWRLTTHDIWFTYERSSYLQHTDDDVLTQFPFKWVPEPRPVKKKRTPVKTSFLSGFGAGAVQFDDHSGDEPAEDDFEPYPDKDYALRYMKRKHHPSPEECILNLINSHLKMTTDGRKLNCQTIDDLVDCRVLVALVNSFIPNLFTMEVLLNDRWTINLVLRTAEKIFYAENPFDSEDLVEANSMSVCAYFCFFFMIGYKFRQCGAVLRRHETFRRRVNECDLDLSRLSELSDDSQVRQRMDDIKAKRETNKTYIADLDRFNVPFCREWIDHASQVVDETNKLIKERIKNRFESFKVPRNITTNSLCLTMVINLMLTRGQGFYKCTGKESVTEQRRVVIRNKPTGTYHEDFSGWSVQNARRLLGLPLTDTVDIDPRNYPNYDIFVECLSRNRLLKCGTEFLYQIFPGTTLNWQKIFIKAAKENETGVVKNLAVFFKNDSAFLNCRDPTTGKTALHYAAQKGHYAMTTFLLEQGVDFNATDTLRQTPLFLAVEGLYRPICHLLIEWGCDVAGKSVSGLTAFDMTRNAEVRTFLIDLHDYYAGCVPQVMAGDAEKMHEMINNHKSGLHPMASLSSRCIAGSTLLHTAAYYGREDVVNELLILGFPVEACDYKGATAVHRAKNQATLKLLLDAAGHVNARDMEGNTPLHVKCYGESGQESDLSQIIMLLEKKAAMTARNHRGLLPIHCAATQGRTDVVELLMDFDHSNEIVHCLQSEGDGGAPSPANLALAGGFLEAAKWFIDGNMGFKPSEPNRIMKLILFQRMTVADLMGSFRLLLENGADADVTYKRGNTTLHQAARTTDGCLVLPLLLEYNDEIDTPDEDMDTALHVAVRESNYGAASVLIAHGADVRAINNNGMTPFDIIQDFEDWINSGFFSADTVARLKACSLRHSRELIRAISARVKQAPQQLIRRFLATTPRVAFAPIRVRRAHTAPPLMTSTYTVATANDARRLESSQSTNRTQNASKSARQTPRSSRVAKAWPRYSLPPVTSASVSQLYVTVANVR